MTLWEPLQWVCFAVIAKTVHQQTLDQVMQQKPVSCFYTWTGVKPATCCSCGDASFIPETHIFRFSPDTSIIVTLYVQTQPCGHQCFPLAMCLRYFSW